MKRLLGLALVATGLSFSGLNNAVGPTRLHAQNRDRAVSRLAELSDSFEALSERVSPAVVQIVATGFAPLTSGASGQALYTRQQVGGSGVIVDPDGYIVTNGHVVDGAAQIRVRLAIPYTDQPPGASILRPAARVVGARVVGVDSETDIAVLKVDQTDLEFLSLGDSDELRKGQLVFAFGSPHGLENSVTMGVVSSVARQLQPDAPMIYIQTDAPINPGSSGGPLVDPDGRIMGINTFILSASGGNEGLGFAVPSNIVKNVVEQIKRNGFVLRGEIGIHAQTINPAMAEGLGLSRDWGVVVGDVYPGSPASRAGLQVGDVIVTLNGRTMENGRQFNVGLYNRNVGEEVTLEVVRGTQSLTVTALVTERPNQMDRFSPLVTAEENLVSRLGILAVDLDERTASLLPPTRRPRGVVVAARSPGVSVGTELLPGDVIYAMNGREVTSLRELKPMVESVRPASPIVLQIERGGRLMFLAIEL